MRARSAEAGMVTAETAVVMPFLVGLAFLLVWIVSLGVTQVRLVDAAREGARMSARGDTPRAVQAASQQLAPSGATVRVRTHDGRSVVTVEVHRRLELPLFAHLPRVALQARAVSLEEPP